MWMSPIDPPPAPLKDEDRNGVNADDHRWNGDKTNVRERIPSGYNKERPRNSVKQPDPGQGHGSTTSSRSGSYR
jgi:hypothetical protein